MEQYTLRTSPTNAIPLLAATSLFGALGEPSLRRLAPEVEWICLPGGATLFQQGDVGDSLYVVIQGRLRVFTDRPSVKDHVIGEVSRGEIVGEMAVLSRGRRSATVRAVRDTELVRLSSAGFERLMERDPRVMMQLAPVIVERLRQAIHPTPSHTNTRVTIALVPAGHDVPLADFAARLAGAFASIGRTLHLNSARLDDHLGHGSASIPPDDPGNSGIVHWLNEQEEKHDFVVYEADHALSAWTSRCLRHADSILIVACAEATPEFGSLEAELARRDVGVVSAQRELVLLHRDGKQPGGTAEWLRPRRVHLHHHVRLHAAEDFARLVRFLTGRTTGLVLGGGGARGFAHIGVIRALAEAGIPIDLIGGVSAGAFVAAQYAVGWDWEQMVEVNKEAFAGSASLHDYVVPIASLISSQRYIERLALMFGDVRIEDLWTKYFCVTANLTEASEMIHREGLLRRWVRASAAVPGIAPPEVYNDNLLVDGGVLNNLPVDVMRRLSPGSVIAVDVSPRLDLAMHPRDAKDVEQHSVYLPSAWGAFTRWLNPFSKTTSGPHIFDILLRAASLSSEISEQRVKEHADVYIEPPVGGVTLLEWRAIDKLVDLGYQAGREQIEKWLKERTRGGNDVPRKNRSPAQSASKNINPIHSVASCT